MRWSSDDLRELVPVVLEDAKPEAAAQEELPDLSMDEVYMALQQAMCLYDPGDEPNPLDD